jgi:hypothetical protein
VPWAWLIPYFYPPVLILFVRVKLTRPTTCTARLLSLSLSTTFNQNVVDPQKHIPELNGEQKETNHSGNQKTKKKKHKNSIRESIYQIPGGFFKFLIQFLMFVINMYLGYV